MGSHTNFYLLILSLLRLKEEFYRIKSPKLRPLIKLLKTKNIEWIDGDEEVPTNKELAKDLGISVTKCNSWLKDLQKALIQEFQFDKPLEITKVVHDVIIMLDWEESKKAEKNPNWDVENTFSMKLNLLSTPRVGDYIKFENTPANNFDRGIVQEVRHKIEGKTQVIEIYAHPWQNEYKHWLKIKNEYERWH